MDMGIKEENRWEVGSRHTGVEALLKECVGHLASPWPGLCVKNLKMPRKDKERTVSMCGTTLGGREYLPL